MRTWLVLSIQSEFWKHFAKLLGVRLSICAKFRGVIIWRLGHLGKRRWTQNRIPPAIFRSSLISRTRFFLGLVRLGREWSGLGRKLYGSNPPGWNPGPHNNHVCLSLPGPQSRPIPAVPTSSRPRRKPRLDGVERNHVKTASIAQRRQWLGHRGGGGTSSVYTRSGGDIYTGSSASTRGTPLADRRHPVGVRFSPVVLTSSSSPFHHVHLSSVYGLCWPALSPAAAGQHISPERDGPLRRWHEVSAFLIEHDQVFLLQPQHAAGERADSIAPRNPVMNCSFGGWCYLLFVVGLFCKEKRNCQVVIGRNRWW
jgi:hypothetical protein